MLATTQLIGFGARRLGVSSLSFFDAGTFLGLPGDILAGDLIVIVTDTSGPPSGYTQINTDGSAQEMSAKIADGTEGGTNPSGFLLGLVFRGDVPIKTFAAASPNAQITSGNPTAQNVTASSGTPPLVVIGSYWSSGAVNPRTMSPAKDGEVGFISDLGWLAYKIYNSSPSDVSVDMDDEGNNNSLMSLYISVS